MSWSRILAMKSKDIKKRISYVEQCNNQDLSKWLEEEGEREEA